MEMKIYKNDAGHMTNMAAMPIYGRIPLNIFLPGNSETIPKKLDM